MRDLFSTPQFEKDLAKTPREVRSRADNTISILREDPLAHTLNLKKLKGFTPSVYRVRIGSYRLAYSFTKTTLTLHRFRHRKDIYRSL
ncbi:MAG: type II toxin-antitoxin system RelE/ParE family toxin [Candidatus Wildermuthbacteria bacterium]|nr:type II toxin-antitoxin system RelE/ParE family toxin [Candidatus Wildermuthbacteria bacterium]